MGNPKKHLVHFEDYVYTQMIKCVHERAILTAVSVLLLTSLLPLGTCFSQINRARALSDWRTDKANSSVDLMEYQVFFPKGSIPAFFGRMSFWNMRQSQDRYLPNEPFVVVIVRQIEKAYPLSVLMYHQVINDKVAGVPIAVTYCPISNSIAVYDRRKDPGRRGSLMNFAASGMLRAGNTVLYDLSTESWWQQASGLCTTGKMEGTHLVSLPFTLLTFEEYFDAYPYGLVLNNSADELPPYGTTPYYKYEDINKEKPELFLGFPDERLPAMSNTMVIPVLEEVYLFTATDIQERGVLNAMPNDVYLAFFHSENALSLLDERNLADAKKVGAINIFSAFFDNKRLTFQRHGDHFVDEQSQSKWDISGNCFEGRYQGSRLTPVVHGKMFAATALALWPEAIIYEPGE